MRGQTDKMAFVRVYATASSRTPGQRAKCAQRKASSSVAVAAASVALLCMPDFAFAAGLTAEGRLDRCKGDEACISTSSVGNPVKFAPPWTYESQTFDADTAWASLKQAILQIKDPGIIVESRDGPTDFYVRAEFPSFTLFGKGIDDVEFKLLPADKIVTVRSASREAIFIYPIQTPINTGKNKTRLQNIRTVLGWPELDGQISEYASPDVQLAPDFLPDFE